MKPRIVMLALAAAMVGVHALVAWWTPIQGDDWKHWIWAGQHRSESGLAWLAAFASGHFTFADVTSYVLARAPIVHVLVTPLAMVALVVGLFTVAVRRLPRATWDDVLGLALVSTALWIAQPKAGFAFFHITHVPQYVYGVALATWFVAPLRCGWQPPRWTWPVLALAGYCVGTSSRAVATVTLVGFIIALRSLPRVRWMWIAFGGLLVGTIVGYLDPPWIEFGRVFRRGLEPNLIVFRTPLEELGELVALTAGLVLLNAVLRASGRAHASVTEAPEPRETRRWLVAWFGTAIWCMFGPRYVDATLLPATAVAIFAALPYLQWLATTRWLRGGLVGIALGAHVVVWSFSLVLYRKIAVQRDERMATLLSTPPGEIARLHPYWDVVPTFWFLGEDFGTSGPRQLVAIGAFGLRDIELSPPYRRYEANPQVIVQLETDRVSDAELAAARPPALWGGELSVARNQFEKLARRLQRGVASARLTVKHIDFPERAGRPLLAAWLEGRELVAPRIARAAVQQNSRHTIRIYPPYATRFDEAWLLVDGVTRKLKLGNGVINVQAMNASMHVVIVCDKTHCLAADAFTPRL